MNDLRSAVRAFVRDPWFTLVLVFPLSLGIGVNAGLIGIVDSLLSRPLPGIAADRLSWVSAVEQGSTRPAGISYPEIADLRGAGVFEAVAAFRAKSFNLGGGREPERAPGQVVTGNYFDTLGVRPAAGRWFRPEEDRAGAAVAVISHDLWQRRYAGAASAVGQPLVVNGLDCTIVGVAPRGFVGTTLADRPPQVWVPASLLASMQAEAELLVTRDHGAFESIGRVKAGISARAAEEVLRGLAANLDPAGGRRLAGYSLTPVRGSSHPSDRGDVASLAAVAFAVSSVVLLVACANVAALLLGRATTRAREIGIRLALGASRGRIVRQLLAESLLVSIAAGLVALVLAWWTTRALVAWLGVPFPMGVAPDLATLGGTFGVSAVAAVLFGLVPALHATRRGLVAGALGAGGIAGATRGRARLQRASAVFQVALSLALLAAAGVLVGGERADQQTADADAEASRIIAASVDLGAQGYTAARQQAFASDLIGTIQSLPGVESCSLGMAPPGRGAMYRSVEPGAAARDPRRRLLARSDWVWPNYFRTMGMAVVRGRDFSPRDTAGTAAVAVVTEALAAAAWPGQDPLGRQLRFGPGDRAPHTVVGVVRDRPRAGDPPEPAVFLPRGQIADDRQPWVVLVRTSGPAAVLVPALRHAVRGMDPALPLFDVATLRGLEGERLRARRAAAGVVNGLGAVALLLAALGVYGLVSWKTARRQREIGVRMALGATPGDVLRLVASDGLRIAGAGSAIGLALGAAAARLMSSLAGRPTGPDVWMLLAATAMVWMAVSAASCLPARRATRVNPADVLRAE